MLATALTSIVLWVVPPLPSPVPLIVHQACPADPLTSCYYPGGAIYYNPAGGPYRYDLEHELGHAYEAENLTPRQRNLLSYVLRWRHWHSEQFADLYAACRMELDPRNPTWRAQQVWPRRLTLRGDARLCRLMAT